MIIAVTNPSVFIVTELLLAMSWYRMSKAEVNFVLLGVSLGLKAHGYSDPNLELAIASGKPELFLGKEGSYHEQESRKEFNQ